MELEEVDRFSSLPLHIIHDILLLLPNLPEDVARTSVLSKRWKEIKDSLPVFYFDQNMFFKKHASFEEIKLGNSTFKRFVEDSLERFVSQNLNIWSMKVHIIHIEERGMMHNISKWMNIAIKANIRELSFDADIHPRRYSYHLPLVVLTSKTLTSLQVYGCQIRTYKDNIKLYSLKKLSLGYIYSKVGERSIQSLISSCTTIEELRIEYCSGLKTLQVSNHPKLKIVHLHYCDLTSVDVQAPTLESFYHCGYDEGICSINLRECKSIIRLTLESTHVGDFLRDQLRGFSVLEELILRRCNCNAWDDVIISFVKLKILVLSKCRDLKTSYIYTPNLVLLEYTGQRVPFLFVYSKNFVEVKFNLKLRRRYRKHLQEFLKGLSHIKGSKLIVKSHQLVFIHVKPTEIVLPPTYEFELELIKPSKSCEDIIEDLLQSGHVKGISTSSQKIIKILMQNLIKLGKANDNKIENALTEDDNKEHGWNDLTIRDEGMQWWKAYLESWTTLSTTPTTFMLEWGAYEKLQCNGWKWGYFYELLN